MKNNADQRGCRVARGCGRVSVGRGEAREKRRLDFSKKFAPRSPSSGEEKRVGFRARARRGGGARRGAREGRVSGAEARTLMSVMDMPQFWSSSMQRNDCGSCSYCTTEARGGRASGTAQLRAGKGARARLARRPGVRGGVRDIASSDRTGRECDIARRTSSSPSEASSASASTCTVGSFAGSYGWVWVVGFCDCVAASCCEGATCVSMVGEETSGGEESEERWQRADDGRARAWSDRRGRVPRKEKHVLKSRGVFADADAQLCACAARAPTTGGGITIRSHHLST